MINMHSGDSCNGNPLEEKWKYGRQHVCSGVLALEIRELVQYLVVSRYDNEVSSVKEVVFSGFPVTL